MHTFADKIIKFNESLEFTNKLPQGIRIMNPFKENETVLPVSSAFYKKYYSDNHSRYLILGINPGRFGAGLTGIPFTDPKRLIANCHIEYTGELAHEPSSAFVYDVIRSFGGEHPFYSKFYINSVCPLGFTSIGDKGKEVNYNYYDSKELKTAVYDFIVTKIKEQLGFGIRTDVCFCFGTGHNKKFILQLNNEFGLFKKIIALEHPRYIMQYKAKKKQEYIDKYLEAFR